MAGAPHRIEVDLPTHPDDLLARVACGDREAFDALYDQLAPRLFAVATRILGPGPDAEEALQEAFVKAWGHADQWPGDRGTAAPWLLTIARNAAIDRRRAAARRARHMHGLSAQADVLPVAAPQAARTPEHAAALASDAQHLIHCLEALPEGRAEVIREAYFAGASYAELAEATGRPEGTLKSWVHRSLAALRRCLEDRGVEDAT